MAFKEACLKASPIILVSDESRYYGARQYLGVLGDISSRRGQITGMVALTNAQRISAFVPLSEMFGYATSLRSRTQGRGVFVMQTSHFEEVPASVYEQLAR